MYPQRHQQPRAPQIRVNHRIRATEVRVIDEEGKQAGVLPIAQAMKMASDCGRDLVEVAPEARPPVCRIIDFGKYRYEQAKKHKGEHSHASKLKELKFHVNIGEHDYGIKINHARGFLEKSMRVKLSVVFRGRELARQDAGMQLIHRSIRDLAECAHYDSEPRLMGKNLHVILVPGKAKPKTPSDGPARPAPAASSSEGPKPFGTAIKIDLKPTPGGSH